MDVDSASSSTPAPSKIPSTFTVYAREECFSLTRSQIEFDQPNYFTAAFLTESFTESTTRTIQTDKHPDLFALIVEYLSGYDIFPIPKEAFPLTMNYETAIKNLAQDARYFGLDTLAERLQPRTEPPIVLPEALQEIYGTHTLYPLSRFSTSKGGDLDLELVDDKDDIDEERLRVRGEEADSVFVIKNVPVKIMAWSETYDYARCRTQDDDDDSDNSYECPSKQDPVVDFAFSYS